MKTWAVGAKFRDFRCIIPTDQLRVGKSTGSTLSVSLFKVNRSTEPDSAEINRLVAIRCVL